MGPVSRAAWCSAMPPAYSLRSGVLENAQGSGVVWGLVALFETNTTLFQISWLALHHKYEKLLFGQ